MTGDCHIRFRENERVKFPCVTQLVEIMKRYTTILLAVIVTTSFSCKNDRKCSEIKKTSELQKTEIPLHCKDNQKSSKIKKLSEFKETEFIPTLEHEINSKKNSVYCVALLYAWDEIRKTISDSLEVSEQDSYLTLLNNSKSFVDVLKSNEYSASGKINGELITARAEFSKSLPFEITLQKFKNRLTFCKDKVASFGVNVYDCAPELLKIIKISYYKNDNNFIITLFPKDKEHEIILFKSEKIFNSMNEMNLEIQKLTKIGNAERRDEKQKWKYYFTNEDEVVIPKFNFDIETNYPQLEGNIFETSKQNFQIIEVWQRTAFILDENGAKIESEGTIRATLSIEKPKPKKMVFDKPFLLLLKRTDAKNPYFGMWITNSELMIKE